MNVTGPFALSLASIVALSLLGLPIGHAMIGASVLYLLAAGADVGTAAEQVLNGMFTSFLLLAIPLFILAAEFMNAGSVMDRLLRLCNALVGRFRALQRELDERVGPATSSTGTPTLAFVRKSALQTVVTTYGYRDYVATAMLLNFGKRGLRLREQYRWLPPLPESTPA